MRWIGTILHETFGLFVDDWKLAATIAVWLLIAGVALPRLATGASWAGVILFAGLAIILVESAVRRARR